MNAKAVGRETEGGRLMETMEEESLEEDVEEVDLEGRRESGWEDWT